MLESNELERCQRLEPRPRSAPWPVGQRPTAGAPLSVITTRLWSTLVPAMRLRSHLALLVLGAVLPVLIFTVAILRQEFQDQRAVLDQGMRNTGRAVSLAVDGEVKASAYLDTGDLKAFYELCARTIVGRTNACIILFDAIGQQLVNSSRPFGAPLPNPLLSTRAAGTDPRYFQWFSLVSV